MGFFTFTDQTDAVNKDELQAVASGSFKDTVVQDPKAPEVTSFNIVSAIKMPLLLSPYSVAHNAAGRGQYLAYQDRSGKQWLNTGAKIIAQEGSSPFKLGQLFVARTAATGSIATAFKLTSKGRGPDGEILIGPNDLIDANSFPLPAAPTANMIPPGSPRMLVGLGLVAPGDPTRGILLHDQYWRVSPSSFPLATAETKTIVLTYRSGVSDTSSSEDTIAKYLGVDASGGWGPVSVAISASISATQNTTHTRALTESRDSTTEISLANGDRDPERAIIYWELMDCYTFVQPDGVSIIGSVENVQSPALVRIYPPFV